MTWWHGAVLSKLYILNVPTFIKEGDFRRALASHPIASLSFARWRGGGWAVIETFSARDLEAIVAELSAAELCHLSMVVPRDAESAARLDAVFRTLKSREVNA